MKKPRRRHPGSAGAVLALIFAVSLGGACVSGSILTPKTRVIILGFEGLSWDILTAATSPQEPLSLVEMRRRGAWGVLESHDPVSSAAIWASLATGKTQTDHGVFRGIRQNPETGNLQTKRLECLPLWEIAASRGVSAAQIGWPGSHAASPSPLRIPEWAPYQNSGLFSGRPAPPWPRRKKHFDPASYFSAPVGTESLFAARIAADSLQNVPAYLEKEIKAGTRLIMAYFDGPLSSRHHDGAAAALGLAEESVPRHPPGIAYLRELDLSLARILAMAGPDTYFFFVSDAIIPPKDYKGALGDDAHPINGIFLALGKTVKKGEALEIPTVLDLVPTVLTILHIPVAEDLPGRVMEEIFTQATEPAGSIPSYETFVKADYPEGGVILGAEDRGRIAGLEAHFAGDLRPRVTKRNRYAFDLIAWGRTTGAVHELDLDVRRNAFNPLSLFLRAVLLDARGFQTVALENLDDAKKALSDGGDSPGEKALIVAVAEFAVGIRLRMDNPQGAASDLEWGAARAPELVPWNFLRARVALSKDPEAARRFLKSHAEQNGRSAPVALLESEILLKLGRRKERLAVLENAARDWPENSEVLAALGSAYHNSRRFAQAVTIFEQADEKGEISPDADYLWASSLNGLARPSPALKVLRRMLKKAPLDQRAWSGALQTTRAEGKERHDLSAIHRSALAEGFAFSQYLLNKEDVHGD